MTSVSTAVSAPAGVRSSGPPVAQVPGTTAAPKYTFPQAPLELGRISVADGPWYVDWARAQVDAAAALDSIDFTKRDIYIWVPGTSCHDVHPAFRAALEQDPARAGASLTYLRYEASWEMRRSLPTGLATLLLVLEGIRKRGRTHRVLLGGESQGAWIAGEAAAHPALGRMVDRAVLMGHPWLAANQYSDGHDPRIFEVDHRGDMVTLPIRGSATAGFDAMVGLRTLHVDDLVRTAGVFLRNSAQTLQMIISLGALVPPIKRRMHNPHIYDMEMPGAVRFLDSGIGGTNSQPVPA
ncbi:MAG: hypothetical protein JWN72_2616 [Thermoleophilia bacterium]|nr:hypothetical protein [Thermoleophilia bacterium]